MPPGVCSAKNGVEGALMRRRFKQCATVVALYAVALHVILLGFAPLGAHAASADPFTVICHSTAAGDEVPADPGLAPGQACDHCNLCSTTAAPPPPTLALSMTLAPARALKLLHPVATAPRAGFASDPNRARGPPLFA
jgi:hypothetical protein